jgi:hypothetical protein
VRPKGANRHSDACADGTKQNVAEILDATAEGGIRDKGIQLSPDGRDFPCEGGNAAGSRREISAALVEDPPNGRQPGVLVPIIQLAHLQEAIRLGEAECRLMWPRNRGMGGTTVPCSSPSSTGLFLPMDNSNVDTASADATGTWL